MHFEYRAPRPFRQYPAAFLDDRREELKRNVETQVLDWLRDANGLSSLFVSVPDGTDGEIVFFFDRSEMYLKAVHGEWEIWRVASATYWSELITYRVGWVMNFGGEELALSLVLPNEVRIQEYDESSMANWNLFGKAAECPQQLSLPTMPTV